MFREGLPFWEYRALRRMGGSRRASLEQWWAMLWFHDPRKKPPHGTYP